MQLECNPIALRFCSSLATYYEGSCGPRLRAGTLAGAVGLAVVFTGGAAHADDVDTAVDAVVSVGSIAGVPIDATETTVIKGIVRCAISKTAVVNCARQAIIDRLPPEARPLTTCVLNETPIEQCGAAEILQRLPPQARDIVTCITQRTDVGECGQQLVLNAAQKEAFDAIEKLKADGRSELGSAGSGAIRNIIGLSEAIRAEDWVNVGVYGGTEVYKAAAKIVLKAVLPEVIPAGQVLDPIIDAIIQARADLVAKIIRGAKTQDARLVGDAIVEAYLIDGFLVPCAIPQIPDDVKEAVCGTIGKIIHSIADVGGEAADFALRLIKDPLGIPDTVWAELEDLGATVFQNKKHDCMPPEQYYATNYVKCYHRGVRQRFSSNEQLDQLIGTLNFHCRTYYDRCFLSKYFDRLCNPQQTMFADHVNRLTSSMNTAANLYSGSFPQFVRDNGQAAACDPQAFIFPQFLDSCARAVAIQVPLAGDPTGDNCDSAPLILSSLIAPRAACERAMAQLDTRSVLGRVCEGNPQAPTGCHAAQDPVCGYIDVTCNAPLPAASEFVLAGLPGKVYRFVSESGGISAEYTGAGNITMSVCARNFFGSTTCGEPFSVTLGRTDDPSCLATVTYRTCPQGVALSLPRMYTNRRPIVPPM
ncbi:MAG: hypothetical protein M3178_12315 [Pseudomonadota bacterium]|nr:hypothetical protein [Pseudomonadota bacterium]